MVGEKGKGKRRAVHVGEGEGNNATVDDTEEKFKGTIHLMILLNKRENTFGGVGLHSRSWRVIGLPRLVRVFPAKTRCGIYFRNLVRLMWQKRLYRIAADATYNQL
ncbi:hypothetical protein E2C01_071265 [Portunus trituberculatus]|uniref:Uncharacterized protein n=1 Tax=Portunus trituberculatus TaxID=210409 RepID=A0A5B7HZI6_PORTR|nr:hypothetical protein [Portunus trituberculatus]